MLSDSDHVPDVELAVGIDDEGEEGLAIFTAGNCFAFVQLPLGVCKSQTPVWGCRELCSIVVFPLL